MQLDTRRFGHLEVDEDDTFTVPNGIPGFPAMRAVVLLSAADESNAAEDQAWFWLQDLDDGDLAFLCIVPWAVFPDYEIDIDERSLGIADGADVRVLALVTTRREDEVVHMTANLRAPLVVDARQRQLQQVILTDSRWPIRAPFASFDEPAEPAPAGCDVAGSVQ